MTIKKINNRNSKHFGQWWVRAQTSVHGKLLSSSVQYTDTKSQAKLLESKLIDQMKSGCDFSTASQCLPAAFSAWVNEQIEMERWSPASIRTWRYTEKMVHCYLKDVKVRSCNENTIRKFITTYSREHHTTITAHSTAAKLLQQLRTYFLTLEGDVMLSLQFPSEQLITSSEEISNLLLGKSML